MNKLRVTLCNKTANIWYGFHVPVGALYGKDKDGQKFVFTHIPYKGDGLILYRYNGSEWIRSKECNGLTDYIQKRVMLKGGNYAPCHAPYDELKTVTPKERTCKPSHSKGKNTYGYMTNPAKIAGYDRAANKYNLSDCVYTAK